LSASSSYSYFYGVTGRIPQGNQLPSDYLRKCLLSSQQFTSWH